MTPAEGVAAWAAYWTVTEHGHSSKVKAGENAGEFLQHDFVVRQYVPAGGYRGAVEAHFASCAAASGRIRARSTWWSSSPSRARPCRR